MPFGMAYYVQSVMVQGKLYVGGGNAPYGSGGDGYTVMEVQGNGQRCHHTIQSNQLCNDSDQ